MKGGGLGIQGRNRCVHVPRAARRRARPALEFSSVPAPAGDSTQGFSLQRDSTDNPWSKSEKILKVRSGKSSSRKRINERGTQIIRESVSLHEADTIAALDLAPKMKLCSDDQILIVPYSQ